MVVMSVAQYLSGMTVRVHTFLQTGNTHMAYHHHYYKITFVCPSVRLCVCQRKSFDLEAKTGVSLDRVSWELRGGCRCRRHVSLSTSS